MHDPIVTGCIRADRLVAGTAAIALQLEFSGESVHVTKLSKAARLMQNGLFASLRFLRLAKLGVTIRYE
jgi:hypothetical protein